MKKSSIVFIVMSCLLVFSIPAYSGNIIGQWKKVDSYHAIQILDKQVGIAVDLRTGKATKFNYQYLGDDMINFEISHSSQVQKYQCNKKQLILSDVNGANTEVYLKYDDASLPGMLKADFQRYLDRNFPGLCKINFFGQSADGLYVVNVMILKNQAKAFSTSGTHISGLEGGLMKKSPFVWLKPTGKKGAYNSSGMWQTYSPDVAKGDVFQVSFDGYF